MPLRALNWRRAMGGGETKPQVFECDDGNDWVLKLPGNPHLGAAGLCADWIGTALAAECGVPVLECALVEVTPTALATMPDDNVATPWAAPGTAFGSRFLAEAVSVLGLQGTPDLGLISRIVVVDTWLDVLDRKKPHGGLWNLLVDTNTPSSSLRVIDFGLSLTELLGPPMLGDIEVTVRCPTEWRPYLTTADVSAAVADAHAIPSEWIDEIVASIPPDWRAAAPRYTELTVYLVARREFLTEAFAREGVLHG